LKTLLIKKNIYKITELTLKYIIIFMYESNILLFNLKKKKKKKKKKKILIKKLNNKKKISKKSNNYYNRSNVCSPVPMFKVNFSNL